MNERVLICLMLLAMLLGYRVVMFVRFWTMPLSLAVDRFFGLPVPAPAARPLLRRYRARFLIVYAMDVCCALAALFWAGLAGLVVEQAVAAILVRTYHSLVGIHFLRQAKWLAVQGSWRPVRSVALSLETRRLRDYTNLSFELILALLTAGPLALVAYLFWRAEGRWPFPDRERYVALAALAVYLQLGGLLVKHSLVRWRMWLPGERTEDYRRWREAVLRYWLWACDYLRGTFTVALVGFVLLALLPESKHHRVELLLAAVVGGLVILVGFLAYERRQSQLLSLWKQLQPLEAFCSPPEQIDAGEYFLGGLCCWKAECPNLFLPGPLVYAVNLANKRAYLFAVYFAGLLVLGTCCVALSQGATAVEDHVGTNVNSEPSVLSPQALRTLAAGVRDLVEDDEAVGAEVLILHRGQVVLHEAFGWADLDRRVPLQPNTIVCVRSMTKPLVGTAIQMLIDDGKLSLTDPASKYLPAFANDKSRAITIEQLLTHTAGFPLTLIDKPLSAYRGPREVADQAGRIGPSSPPGPFRYSDTDSAILAAIVSEVSGQEVDEFIRRRVLEPLRMKDTYCVLEKDAPPRSRVSSNHAGSPGLWHKYWDHEEEPLFPFFHGPEALYSTAADYSRFLALWLNRGRIDGRSVLSATAVERALWPAQPMLSPGSNTPFPTGLSPLRPYYGQHWMVYVPPKPGAAGALPVFGHGGSDGTLALVFPEHDLMALYFTQSRGGISFLRFEELLAPLVGLQGPPARTRLSADTLQPYLGAYLEAGSGKRAWVTRHGKRLRLELAGAGAFLPLWPDGAGRWSFGDSDPGISVSFDKSDAGEVTGTRLWQNGTQLVHFQRVSPAKDLPSVEQLMALRREKQGGDGIDALRSLEIKGRLRVGATEIDNTIVAAGSDQVIRRMRSPAGTETTLVEGGRARKCSPGQPVEELGRLWRDEALRINPLARLRDWRETSVAVRVAGKGHLGDEEVWIVRIECELLPPLTRYVSTRTGLLLKEEAWVTARGVGTVGLTVRYEDYREVAGVKVPFRLTSESSLTGKQVMQFTEAKPNVAIREDTFALPDR
jgi:CubicO group peptidase (beta-lactamase class C family)